MATTYPSGTRRGRRVAADDAAETRVEKGISLARGPALILGTILLAAGLYFLYKAHTFPRFSNFPNGTATRDGNFFFGIFGANGWTGMFTAVCGGLLLFGAAQHLLAKTMSLIVGAALGAAAVISLISGDVLGMAAANGWTELGWAVCAVILLFNSIIPRRRRTVAVADDAAAAGTGAGAAGAAAAPRAGTREPVREPVVADRETTMANRDPAMAERDPAMTTRDPAMTTRDPAMTSQDPAMTNRDPAMGNQEPGMANRDPAMGNQEPAMANREPATAVRNDAPTTTRRRGGLAGLFSRRRGSGTTD